MQNNLLLYRDTENYIKSKKNYSKNRNHHQHEDRMSECSCVSCMHMSDVSVNASSVSV